MKRTTMVVGAVLGGVVGALLAKPGVLTKIKRFLVDFFDDRPVIRVRSGSMIVETWHATFDSGNGPDWDHTPNDTGKWKEKEEFCVVLKRLSGPELEKVAKRVVVDYDGNNGEVDIKAKPNDYLKVKTKGPFRRIADDWLEDDRPGLKIQSVKIDNDTPMTGVTQVIVIPYRR